MFPRLGYTVTGSRALHSTSLPSCLQERRGGDSGYCEPEARDRWKPLSEFTRVRLNQSQPEDRRFSSGVDGPLEVHFIAKYLVRRNNAGGEISPRLSLFSPKQVTATSVPSLIASLPLRDPARLVFVA